MLSLWVTPILKMTITPEEWIFSTNRAITPGRDNPPDKGLSRIELPNGEVVLLKALLDAFPEETLGGAHVAKYGTELGVLLKIFDVGEGAHIPIHWHPNPDFAQEHLDSPFGKNEAWILIGTRPGAKAWIGWKEAIDKAEFRRLMEAQDVPTLRSLMHVVEPKVGEVYFLRTPIVHSLGTGFMCPRTAGTYRLGISSLNGKVFRLKEMMDTSVLDGTSQWMPLSSINSN